MRRARLNSAEVARLASAHPNSVRAVVNGKADMTWEKAEGVLESLGYVVLIVPQDANKLSAFRGAE